MGARNPMNSWDKSDTKFDTNSCPHTPDGYCGFNDCPALGISLCPVSDEDRHKFTMGEKDLSLLSMLSKAGTDHGKFLRMIPIYVDITAPMYWWSEYDTYKVGTVANSCSKMHKIHAKRFEQEDFSIEYLDSYWKGCINSVISLLNVAREKYLETKDKKYWWQMIQLLPASYNQKRTVSLNYQVLKNIYFARKDHKLDEWHTFCDWIKTLPYAKELIFDK